VFFDSVKFFFYKEQDVNNGAQDIKYRKNIDKMYGLLCGDMQNISILKMEVQVLPKL
jgi:hypothetical protein